MAYFAWVMVWLSVLPDFSSPSKPKGVIEDDHTIAFVAGKA